MDNTAIQTVNLRDLHKALGVGRDFSTWANDRITKFGFVEGQDYTTVSEPIEIIDPQNGGTIKSMTYDGVKVAIEYHVSLDMAKELAMVENNEKGRQIRRYFIAVERKYREGTLPAVAQSPEASRKEMGTRYREELALFEAGSGKRLSDLKIFSKPKLAQMERAEGDMLNMLSKGQTFVLLTSLGFDIPYILWGIRTLSDKNDNPLRALRQAIPTPDKKILLG